MEKVKDTLRYNHVISSLMFCSQALQELKTLTTKYELEPVNHVIRQAPFNYFRGTLTFMITIEYCKIFNPDDRKEQMSSINRLWNEACKVYPSLKKEKHGPTLQKLKDIKKGELLLNITQLRNKRVAHSDDDDINRPFKLKLFDQDELQGITDNLDVAIDVLNIISKQEDGTILEFPHQSTGSSQTRNFIHYTAIAKAFYDKNMILAYRQGYQVYQHKIVTTEDHSTTT